MRGICAIIVIAVSSTALLVQDSEREKLKAEILAELRLELRAIVREELGVDIPPESAVSPSLELLLKNWSRRIPCRVTKRVFEKGEEFEEFGNIAFRVDYTPDLRALREDVSHWKVSRFLVCTDGRVIALGVASSLSPEESTFAIRSIHTRTIDGAADLESLEGGFRVVLIPEYIRYKDGTQEKGLLVLPR